MLSRQKIIQMVARDFKSPEFTGRSSLACSRLRDSRASGIEKARTRQKKTGGNFSLSPALPQIFARPTLSRLSYSFAPFPLSESLEQARWSFAISFQILLAPCLHVRQPHSQGSRAGRREPWERGCMCAAFFSSRLSNLCWS